MRDEWMQAIREAKAALLVNLNTMQPNTTLTSSSSNAHIRAMLRALPYTGEGPETGKRLGVDHFTPPVWVPDHKTSACMRCARKFTWLVRRHHCRLCGRCVCASCSGRVGLSYLISAMEPNCPGQTFFVGDIRSKKGSSTAARACNACYDAVFPIIKPSTPMLPFSNAVSTGTLSGLPNWKTTKQSSFDPSLLRLLGDARSFNPEEGDERDDLEPHPDELLIPPHKRVQRRLSSPVIALQTPAVIAQSQNNVINPVGRSVGSNGASPLKGSQQIIGDNAISELQKVLNRT